MSELTTAIHNFVSASSNAPTQSERTRLAFVLLVFFDTCDLRKMLRRTVAALLLTLVVLPFTAPFPTCDAETLFGDRAPMSSHAPSIDHGQHALPTFSSTGRMRPKFITRLDALGRVTRLDADSPRRARPAPSARHRDTVTASLVALRI
jgi:hypothetical protein